VIAGLHLDSLGPLSHVEHEALLLNILFVASMQGTVSFENIVAESALARRMARDHPDGLPWRVGKPVQQDSHPILPVSEDLTPSAPRH
jgi:hypothetical protein